MREELPDPADRGGPAARGSPAEPAATAVQAARAEQREDLSRALSLLTKEENLLLSLRYTHRLSQRDAANRLNKTQMQISRMERRILAALRKELSETP